MKVLVQRVRESRLSLKEDEARDLGSIGQGLLVFVGIEEEDRPEDLDFLVNKLVNLRIFEDEQGKLNLSVKDKGLEIMCIPNFTLAASTERGRRPSFDKAASGEKAKEFFELFWLKIKEQGLNCIPGVFGASMLIEAKNYGPVNIILNSRLK